MRTPLAHLLAATLAVFGMAAHAGVIDLGKAGDYTMLASAAGAGGQPGLLQLGSESLITGNIGGRGSVQLASGAQISGRADGGSFTIGAGASVNGGTQVVSNTDWNAVQADLVAASNAARALGGSELGFINTSRTLTGNGGLNVYHSQQGMLLGAGSFLTLSGGADDVFVINVASLMNVGSGAGILLDGVRAENVFFNFYGYANNGSYSYQMASIFGGASFAGNLLAPNMFVSIGDGATLNGVRILAGSIMGNVQVVTPPDEEPPVDVPVPATLLLFAGGLLLMRRRPH